MPSVAERGLGTLMLTVGGPDLVAAEVAAYWAALKSSPITMTGKGVNPAVFTFTFGLVAPTDELADERGRDGVDMFGYGMTGAAQANVNNPDHHLNQEFRDFKAGRGDTRLGANIPQMLLDAGANFSQTPGAMFGGPERAREFARAIEATNADGLLLNQNFGFTTHEHQMESIEIWATQVIPEFRERQAAHDAWRREQLKHLDLPIVSSL
jgi:hypothetical protein